MSKRPDHVNLALSRKTIERKAAQKELRQLTEDRRSGAEWTHAIVSNDTATEPAIIDALNLLNEHGKWFKAATDHEFLVIKTGDLGEYGQEPGKTIISELSLGFNKIGHLRIAKVDARDYGEAFKVEGAKNKVKHREFSIRLDDFATLCEQYGVAIRPGLQDKIMRLSSRSDVQGKQ